jgi:hypothetical protein
MEATTVQESQFAVEYKGERYEVGKPGTKALVLLERQFKIGAQSIQDEPRFEHMVFLAYVSLKGQGVVTGPYTDEFLDDIEIVTSDEDADEAGDEDPTGATPSQPHA